MKTPSPVPSPETAEPRHPYPLDENVARLVEAQAIARPEAIAIAAGPATMSYRELAVRIGEFGHVLVQRGVEPEQPIGILMRRSPDLVAVLLAVLKVGGAYVPLDPDDPADRNLRILESSGCRVVLGDHASIASLRRLLGTQTDRPCIDFVPLDRLQTGFRTLPSLPTAPGGRRLAYILFTSGSTGAPKGVEVEHRSVINLLHAARDLLGFTSADRFLASSTIGFDISVAELFLPLITGGSLLLRDRSIWLDPRRLADEVRNHGVTVLQTGPTVWSVVLAEVPDFPRVRAAITTAEPVPPELARRLASLGDQVWNLYGPTEATVWATAQPLSTTTRGSPISAPIGRPIANVTAVILDEDLRPVADGETGELCLGGEALARGYRNDPAQTRERFIPWGPGGQRLYRTGDLVARDADGTLAYFGRNDDQVKVRGVRIEPREVEASLLSHPEIAQAAATWFANGSGAKSIVAALVTKTGLPLSPADLRPWLERRLPAQMIPARFLFRAALPRSPSGKVDRQTIRQDAVAAALNETAVPLPRPLSPTESAVAEIWRRILQVETIAPDDHFFSIGGDSLAAVRMVTEAEAAFRIELPPHTTFEAPTLARFAARIERIRERRDGNAEKRFLFPLVEDRPGAPLFFSNVDLRLATRGTWRVPCPLYSVSHWAQGTGFTQAGSVADLAREHLAAVRQVQPRGPYRIAGYSFGGLVALEMAQQLRAAGDEVELLFLLDPMQPYRTEQAPGGYAMEGVVTPLDERWTGRIARHARQLARQPAHVAAYVGEKLRWHVRAGPARQWLVYQLVHLHGYHPNPISSRLLPKNRWPAFWYSARRMAQAYLAQSYHGRVMAVFPNEGERYRVWRSLLGPRAEIHVTEASHDALFQDPVMGSWMSALTQAFAPPDRPS